MRRVVSLRASGGIRASRGTLGCEVDLLNYGQGH